MEISQWQVMESFLASSRRSVSWGAKNSARKNIKSAVRGSEEHLWANLTKGRSGIHGQDLVYPLIGQF